jgi:ribosomal protein S18 acetylase RimI-like enzyme
MPILIRPATAADVPVMVEYNRRLARETEQKELDPAVLTAGVCAALADPNKGPYFLAEIDGAVVGQLQITFEFSDWRNGWIWWIQGVYVRADARGRGVFRALYEHVVNQAQKDPQVIALRLYVERDNQAAQQTYLRLGLGWTSYLVMERTRLRAAQEGESGKVGTLLRPDR